MNSLYCFLIVYTVGKIIEYCTELGADADLTRFLIIK